MLQDQRPGELLHSVGEFFRDVGGQFPLSEVSGISGDLKRLGLQRRRKNAQGYHQAKCSQEVLLASHAASPTTADRTGHSRSAIPHAGERHLRQDRARLRRRRRNRTGSSRPSERSVSTSSPFSSGTG